MADPKHGDPKRGQENGEQKPDWNKGGKPTYREWLERRWPTKALKDIIEKALRLTEKGPCITRENGTWWQKGSVEIDFVAVQLPSILRTQAQCEDRVFCLPDRGLFVVSDGLGGPPAGEKAAALLGLTTVAYFPKDAGPRDGGAGASMEQAAVASQNLLERYGAANSERELGACTVMVYIHPEGKGERTRATIGGSGDVEVYRLRPDGSVDVVYRSSRIARLRHIPQERSRSMKDANVVMNCIGGTPNDSTREVRAKHGHSWQEEETRIVNKTIENDLVIQDIMLEPGEIFLVATDGLHDNLAIRRTDEDWKKPTGLPRPETLESIVCSCKTHDGKIDIAKLNQKLLAITHTDKQIKDDDRGWTIIAPKVKKP